MSKPVKVVVLVACFYLITRSLIDHPLSWNALKLDFSDMNWLFVVLMLMPFNWILEAEKWRLTVPHELLSRRRAIEIILMGQAANWILPLGLGDLGTRLSNAVDKRKATQGLLLTRGLSLFITTSIGIGAGMYLFNLQYHYLSLVVLIFVFVCVPFFQKDVVGVVWLSLVRYFIFTLQFMVLLWIFLPQFPFELLFYGTGWIFFFRTVVPSLFGNFGIREGSALLFFEPYVSDLSLILIPCGIIWVINMVLPSIMGTILLLKFRPILAR